MPFYTGCTVLSIENALIYKKTKRLFVPQIAENGHWLQVPETS